MTTKITYENRVVEICQQKNLMAEPDIVRVPLADIEAETWMDPLTNPPPENWPILIYVKYVGYHTITIMGRYDPFAKTFLNLSRDFVDSLGEYECIKWRYLPADPK